jgi:hypothetical protein
MTLSLQDFIANSGTEAEPGVLGATEQKTHLSHCRLSAGGSQYVIDSGLRHTFGG